MLKTLYLAECSKTYRHWIPRLVKGYVREVVDLWETPQSSIELGPKNLLIIDEAFLGKGPGPACTVLASLLEPRRIVTIPIIVLRRRERRVRELSPRVFEMRRPFYSNELDAILSQFCPEGRIFEEVIMPEENEKIVELDAATLEKITREAIEKVVREIIPPMAEKIVKDEIRRLTE